MTIRPTSGTTVKHGSSENRAELVVEGDDALEKLHEYVDEGYLELDSEPNRFHVIVEDTTTPGPDTNGTRAVHEEYTLPPEIRGYIGEGIEPDGYNDSAPLPDGLRTNASGPGGSTGPRHIAPERSTSHTERNWKRLTDDDREKADINPGTSYHAVLYTIGKENGDGIRWSEIVENNSAMVEGTVGSALNKLWKNKLVERYETTNEDDNYAVFYTINDHGREWLNEHPPLTIDAWADQ